MKMGDIVVVKVSSVLHEEKNIVHIRFLIMSCSDARSIHSH